MPNYPGWGFFKFNPWRAKFDQLIMRHIEVTFSGEIQTILALLRPD